MNNKGFVTISLTLFIPFLMIISFGSLWVLWFINQKHQVDNICNQFVLKSQTILEEANQKLLSFNLQARQLIIRKKILETVILTAPPQIKPFAKAQRKAVIAEQQMLNLKQKSIIYGANLQSRNSLFQLKKNLQKKFLSIEKFWMKTESIKPHIIFNWKPTQIEVDWKDTASTYKRSHNHSNLQVHQVHWFYDIKSIIPGWLKKLVALKPLWEGECSSHPHQKGVQWYAWIGKGNHLLKQWP